MEQKHPPSNAAPHIEARRARGGEIILADRGERMLFAGGLAATVLLALLAIVLF